MQKLKGKAYQLQVEKYMTCKNILSQNGSYRNIPDKIQNGKNAILPWKSQVERIKEYVAANLANDLGIATVSQKFELSATTFRHIFRNHQQQSYRHYLEDMRMDKALELLKEGKWIKEVMGATGYKNRTTFNNAFKKRFEYPASYFKK